MTAPAFMFATGIENSVPTINNGRTRIDEMEKCGFYEHWRTDFELVCHDLDIRFLRYGPAIHKTFLGPDRFDWAFADLTFGHLKELDIVPIVDLCHFGVPDWIGNFQNPDFPKLSRITPGPSPALPVVQLYTPVNGIYICATFSASYGWWNEQLTSDQAFITALKNIVKANVLAMSAILDVRPDAIFIQSESSEYFHADNPKAIRPAEIMNARRSYRST